MSQCLSVSGKFKLLSEVQKFYKENHIPLERGNSDYRDFIEIDLREMSEKMGKSINKIKKSLQELANNNWAVFEKKSKYIYRISVGVPQEVFEKIKKEALKCPLK